MILRQQWVQSSHLLMYTNLTMAYHKIQVYFIFKNIYNLLVSKFFVENWFQFLGYFELLLNTELIKPNNLLRILNQVNINLQFTMDRIQICHFWRLWLLKREQKFWWIYTTSLPFQKDMCLYIKSPAKLPQKYSTFLG